MQNDCAPGSPAHPAVADAQHVRHALPAQLPGDGDQTSLWHARTPHRPDVLEHEDRVGGDVQVLRVDPRAEVPAVPEDAGAARVPEEAPVPGRAGLDHGAPWGEITVQHSEAGDRI